MSSELNLFVALYLDEDINRVIAQLLREQGYHALSAHDVEMGEKTDEEQLTYAVEHKMTILVYNRDDFLEIDATWRAAQRTHYGILITPQFSTRQTGEFMRRLLNFLNQITTDEMMNLVRYLSDFK